MLEGRSFHKGKQIDSDIYLIGGGCESIQKYTVRTQTSTTIKEVSYLEYCTMKELNSFSQFEDSIKLSFMKRAGDFAPINNKISVFGHAH